MKSKLKIVLWILLTFSIISCAYFFINRISKDYIVEIQDISVLDSLKDEFIYFGRPNCPSCELFYPLLKEVSREENIQVYYFNTNNFRNKLTEKELETILQKYQVDQVPIIVELKNGVIDSLYGANFVEEQSDDIKVQIRDYLTYSDYPAEYISQYNLIIFAFVICVITVIFLIVLRKTMYNKISCFFAIFVSITTISVFLLSINPTLNYIKNNHLSVIPIMIGLGFVTIGFAIILLILSIWMLHRKVKQVNTNR